MIYILPDCGLLSADPCNPRPEWPQHAVGVALVATGAYLWVRSAIDARRAVRRREAARGLAYNRGAGSALTWAPVVGTASGSSTRVLIGMQGRC